jgi:predicted HicB family RNase H-like nuclease
MMTEQDKPAAAKREPISMITVRLPRSLHDKLLAIAADADRSLNKECLEALANHVTRVGTPEK